VTFVLTCAIACTRTGVALGLYPAVSGDPQLWLALLKAPRNEI